MGTGTDYIKPGPPPPPTTIWAAVWELDSIVRLLAPKTFGPPDRWPPTQTIGPPGVDYWPPI